MNVSILIYTIGAFISTFLGGVFGIHHRDRLHLILGFTAGVLLGVVTFDIFPEISALSQELTVPIRQPMIALVVGFLLFHTVEKLLLIHHAHEDQYGAHKHPVVGIFSALALAGHSFMDGVGIGLGFHASPVIGFTVAVAVIAHDFTDGLNTVSLMLTHKNTRKSAIKLLFLDSITPLLGGLSTFLFVIPDKNLLLYLGFFAGFLLYIGASDILPEAHSEHSSWKTIALTAFGAFLMFTVTSLLL
ncbi:MAG TPA: ZIP family metal transporter [Patescibacteria group bacterium]|nr:ZIP family metal transporter [Patescibacteria group bacterium]